MPELIRCTRCLMLETREGITFDEMGQCQACASSEQKMHINWVERWRALVAICDKAKANAGMNYDCIVPISGGKDSLWQMHVLVKVLHMKPLAVTFSHNWWSKTGWTNLQRGLERLNIDHVMFTPNRDLVNRCAKRSLETIGDACWHCHMGVSAFTLQMAVAYKIPLIIWGESTAEHGRATYDKPDAFDRDYFLKVSAKYTPEQFACEYISERDLYPFRTPSVEECEALGLHGIHLGNYMFWDAERQVEFIRDEYGWQELEIEGAYKHYKSAECAMAGVHDELCYQKRGYGRTTVQVCDDIRAGLLTREQGMELVRLYEQPYPARGMAYYKRITGYTDTAIRQHIGRLRPAVLKGKGLRRTKQWRTVPEAGVPYVQRLIYGEE